MNYMITILITIFILGVQNYLSTRRYWWLGAIVPGLYVIFAIWFKVYKAPMFETGLLILLGVILLGIWANGREQYKKKINKEINKMKSKDIE
ncbi:hypothetical protein [Clostridium beijerinckii]|uniref:hypothetical protein n=1 Tax=Clostridium beijerinckii TaxID=1520 RepID=UPI0022E5C399|nr:hypothetical protein [Clostridium beijerinckii]